MTLLGWPITGKIAKYTGIFIPGKSSIHFEWMMGFREYPEILTCIFKFTNKKNVMSTTP